MSLETKTSGIRFVFNKILENRRAFIGLFAGISLLGSLVVRLDSDDNPQAVRAANTAPRTTMAAPVLINPETAPIPPTTVTSITLPQPKPAPQLAQIVKRINQPETPIAIEPDPDNINRPDQLFISPDGKCAVQIGFVAAGKSIQVPAEKFGPIKAVTDEKIAMKDGTEHAETAHAEGTYEMGATVQSVDEAVDYATQVSQDLCKDFVPPSEAAIIPEEPVEIPK